MARTRVKDKSTMRAISLNDKEDEILLAYGNGSRTNGVKKLMKLAETIQGLDGNNLEEQMQSLILLLRLCDKDTTQERLKAQSH